MMVSESKKSEKQRERVSLTSKERTGVLSGKNKKNAETRKRMSVSPTPEAHSLSKPLID